MHTQHESCIGIVGFLDILTLEVTRTSYRILLQTGGCVYKLRVAFWDHLEPFLFTKYISRLIIG